MAERDDFSEKVKRVLAERVGYRCSMPECRAPTSGPHTEADKRVSVGVAAHITAAAAGGPRYDRNLTIEERCAAENGIWMCQTHGTLVDRDEARFPEALLREWKDKAEKEALRAIGKTVGRTPTEGRGVPALSEKLKAPGPTVDPKLQVIQLLDRNGAAYRRVVRLIEDISKLPKNSIVAYEASRRALLEKFGEDYKMIQLELEDAVTMMEVIVDGAPESGERNTLDALIASVREVATTLHAFVLWAHDWHNEPLGVALYWRPNVRNYASEADAHMRILISEWRRHDG